MMSLIILVFSALFMSCQAQFDFGPFVTGADNPFEQFSVGNEADSGSGDANSGDQLGFGSITNLQPADPEVFGAGFGQFASGNNATSDSGDASSGNDIAIGTVDDASIAAEQVAEGNFAEAGEDGDANAGNEFEVEGDTTDSTIDLDQTATYNTAITDSGFANAGNFAGFDSFTGGSIDQNQQAIGNTAQSNTGGANSGNIFNFGNLSGRKLLKSQDEALIY